MKEVIEYCFYPNHFVNTEDGGETLLDEINHYLAYDKLKLAKLDSSIQLVTLESNYDQERDSNHIYEEDTFALFISHKDEIKRKAHIIKKRLFLYGISSFVAHDDIEPTKEWIVEIERALVSMDALVALLTVGFSSSVWTNQEVGIAHGKEKLILSVKLGEDPKGFIGKWQALAPMIDDENEIAKQIASQLLTHSKTSMKMQDAYFYGLSRIGSFEDCEIWAELLEHIKSVTEDSIKTLIDSYNNNSQAYCCYALNGGRYASEQNLASKINSWLKMDKYTLRNKKIVLV